VLFRSERPGCDQWHAPGVYQIPYRTLYARNINNLFIGGRIMSVSHVAFGSTRVMLTLANAAQAIGMAAAHCLEKGLLPRDISQAQNMARLQRDLMRAGQHIPVCYRAQFRHGIVRQQPQVGRGVGRRETAAVLDNSPGPSCVPRRGGLDDHDLGPSVRGHQLVDLGRGGV